MLLEGVWRVGVQWMFGGERRTALPVLSGALDRISDIIWQEALKKKAKLRRYTKSHYDKQSKLLPPLRVGQRVRVQEYRANYPPKSWPHTGTIVTVREGGLSYEVDMDDPPPNNPLLRNRVNVNPIPSELGSTLDRHARGGTQPNNDDVTDTTATQLGGQPPVNITANTPLLTAVPIRTSDRIQARKAKAAGANKKTKAQKSPQPQATRQSKRLQAKKTTPQVTMVTPIASKHKILNCFTMYPNLQCNTPEIPHPFKSFVRPPDPPQERPR